MDDETKRLFLKILKDIKLDQKVIGDDDHRKWYEFGAYDTLRILSTTISEYPKEDSSNARATTQQR